MSKKTPLPDVPPETIPTTEDTARGIAISLKGPAAEEFRNLAQELGETLAAVKDRVAAYFSDPEHPERAATLFQPIRRAERLSRAEALEAQARQLREMEAQANA
jgi:hypothetical protein